jgi:hypothetical protein
MLGKLFPRLVVLTCPKSNPKSVSPVHCRLTSGTFCFVLVVAVLFVDRQVPSTLSLAAERFVYPGKKAHEAHQCYRPLIPASLLVSKGTDESNTIGSSSCVAIPLLIVQRILQSLHKYSGLQVSRFRWPPRAGCRRRRYSIHILCALERMQRGLNHLR